MYISDESAWWTDSDKKCHFSQGLSVNMAKNGQNRQNMANIAQNMANFGDSSASPPK